jgi:hypothetical protein
MPFDLTYQSLFNTVLGYLERNDQAVKDNIPIFIALAQKRIAKDSKTLGLEVYVTGNFTPGSSVLVKPGRWKNTRTFNFGTGDGFNTRNQLYLRTYEYCREYWPDDTLTGVPKYFSDYGYSNLLIVPTPALAYPFEYAYFEFPQSIDENNQTNWITDNAPELLIYGCLLEAMLFVKDDQLVQTYKQYYVEALVAFNKEDKSRLTDRYSNPKGDA